MSLMLLTAAFLMVRGFQHSVLRGHRIREGSPADGPVRSAPGAVRRGADAAVLRAAGRAGARDAPGVASAGLTQNPPLGLDAFDALAFVPDGFEMPRDRESFTVDDGHRRRGLLRDDGRSRSCAAAASCASDTADAPRVAVVNEQFAKHYWPGADAVGKRIRLDEPRRHAGRDRRRRADHQVPRHHREADRLRLPAAGPASRARGWSCWCGRAAIRCSWSSR